MKEYKDKTLAQTYVWRRDNVFLVSTINRVSSAALANGATYSETLVWECDPETIDRGSIIGSDSHLTDSIYAHQRMVQRIFDTGSCEEEKANVPSNENEGA